MMNTLAREHEIFIIKIEEYIYNMERHFIHVINYMRTLVKVFQNKEMVVKVLICLNQSWKKSL